MQTQSMQTTNPSAGTRSDTDSAPRAKELERELLETEKALAQETLEHARTKETLAYTRGLLDRADKSEVAIHKFLDKQEERHQIIVGKLEEKVVDANRKIATIARELGAKEEKIALLSGAPQLAGHTAKSEPPAATTPALPSISWDVPAIWGTLGLMLSLGIWIAPGWEVFTRSSATASVWFAVAWLVTKFWHEVARVAGATDAPAAQKLKKFCKVFGFVGILFASVFLGLALMNLPSL